MAAEMEKKLQKNKQITVLKTRVGGMQWIYLRVLFCASCIAQGMQKYITGIFRIFFFTAGKEETSEPLWQRACVRQKPV